MMSVPRPAMLVATVTVLAAPAWAMISDSLWCRLACALSTWCLMPRFFRMSDMTWDFSIVVVPTNIGRPSRCRASILSANARHFASSVI